MPISQSDLREIIEESLPPHIIDWLKQREAEEIDRQGEQDRRLPMYITPPPPPEVEEEEPKRDERGMEIIDYTLETKKIRMPLSELKRIIREAQWGRFTGGAAPLDEPPMDSGPMTPEDQQRVFDMLVDSGSDPKELQASGDYPDVDSLSSEVARRHFKRKYSWLDESLLKEEMLKIMDNQYEDLSVYNRIANYALTNDIQGAMADPEVNTDELYWEIDEMRPWVKDVGTDSNAFSEDSVVPDGWDADTVYEFMGDLENAWHKDQAKKDHAAVAADPDKGWLKFMANEFQSVIVPDDLESLGWKEYKNYIRLSPPASLSHAMGEIEITNLDFSVSGLPGSRADFVEFLTKRAAKTLKKRKIYRSPPPMYD